MTSSPRARPLYFTLREGRAARAAAFRCLFVIQPPEMTHWLGVEEVFREEQHNKAKAVFRLHSRKLKNWGFDDMLAEEIIREGNKAEEILKLVEEDRRVRHSRAWRIDRSGWTWAACFLARCWRKSCELSYSDNDCSRDTHFRRNPGPRLTLSLSFDLKSGVHAA